jgi:hypothetical protein
VWRDKIRFGKLDIANPEPLPIGPATVIGDNVGFIRATWRADGTLRETSPRQTKGGSNEISSCRDSRRRSERAERECRFPRRNEQVEANVYVRGPARKNP